MAGLNGLTPTLYQVLQITKMGVPVTPTEINDHIGKGNYASKHILYLKILGYDFTVTKSGQSVVSYTLIKVPDNHNDLIDAASNKKNKVKAPKAAKVAKPKTVTYIVPSNLETAVTGAKTQVVPKATKKAKPAKSVADIKAKNLETLKNVGAKFKAAKKRVREFDDVTEQFGTSGEVATSFSIDNDFDSVEGLDLSKLID